MSNHPDAYLRERNDPIQRCIILSKFNYEAAGERRRAREAKEERDRLTDEEAKEKGDAMNEVDGKDGNKTSKNDNETEDKPVRKPYEWFMQN